MPRGDGTGPMGQGTGSGKGAGRCRPKSMGMQTKNMNSGTSENKENIKIAITAQGNTLDSEVDPRFGRAKTFIVYDIATSTFDVVDNNQNLNAAQGAGIQSAKNIISSGARILFTGNCGPKAFQTLSSMNIGIVTEVSGTVSDAIALFKSGEYELSNNANVESHW